MHIRCEHFAQALVSTQDTLYNPVVVMVKYVAHYKEIANGLNGHCTHKLQYTRNVEVQYQVAMAMIIGKVQLLFLSSLLQKMYNYYA